MHFVGGVTAIVGALAPHALRQKYRNEGFYRRIRLLGEPTIVSFVPSKKHSA